jgi:hypothetical protein
MAQTRQITGTRNGCEARNRTGQTTHAATGLRSRPRSALIGHDDSRPIEIPDALFDALAQRLARLLTDWMADHLSTESSPWLTFEEAVEYTKVPAGTFRKLSAEGTFTAHGGKRKVYHRHELDSALQGLAS